MLADGFTIVIIIRCFMFYQSLTSSYIKCIVVHVGVLEETAVIAYDSIVRGPLILISAPLAMQGQVGYDLLVLLNLPPVVLNVSLVALNVSLVVLDEQVHQRNILFQGNVHQRDGFSHNDNFFCVVVGIQSGFRSYVTNGVL